ncbi:snare domain protein [Ichthyophthirius multifiliis]|uniref:Snare domain protein n=1 Tax=Ichthyophthirius multifiliis TaxID=5932 RepID=G0R5L2_ICHMU|nr:snare domain protein [Ichthyophthirius multifiliis]EGR27272.1 snare domain protein [Ichthyophthirius multifiliis]|eukprot:XP_004024156.1 snare domain protein [Ichthyophthirius multifiliis]
MIISSNRKLSNEVKQKMDNLSQDINNTKKDNPNSNDLQIKEQLYKSIAFSVKQILEECQNSQLDYKNNLKSKTTRQTKYLDANLTEQQLNDICEDPEKVTQLFQQKLFNAPSIQLQNAVSDIQDKFKDILKLEKSVQELHQLLSDIAILVHQQGEMIDDIELNVNSTKKNVDKANQHLKKAKEHHLSAKKKYCCLMIIGMVIIVIILSTTLS